MWIAYVLVALECLAGIVLTVLIMNQMGLFHHIRHKLHLQRGVVIGWKRRDGVIMLGHKCRTCGKVTGIHPGWSYMGQPHEPMEGLSDHTPD